MSVTESPEARRKRMHIRAWRRGTKEMDLILGGYADAHLAGMDAAALDAFEALLAEDDHDLYQWVTGQAAPPARLAPLIGKLAVRTAG
nr:succinate dehydrogenase assembly factor 2 [Rhodovulum tesquicola]